MIPEAPERPVQAKPVLAMADVLGATRAVGGRFDPARLTLFAVFRDEMYFAPAFFDHYRRIGVRQFAILDDRSVDGTRDFLAAQPDCVLLESDLRYGQPIVFVDPRGRRMDQRFGVYLKMALPPAMVPGAYALYADADEFLFLPPGVRDIAQAVDRLRAAGAPGCVASIVEFFPERFADLGPPLRARSLEDLLARYGWFEAEPVAEVDPDGRPRAVGRSKTTKLLARHDIRMPQRGLRRRIRGLFRPEYRKSPQFKTPVFRCGPEDFLVGSHEMKGPAPRDLLLAMAHFVFTSQLGDKVRRALEWRSHLRGSEKYEHYARLIEKAGRGDGRLAEAASARFVATDQLVAAGLLRW